jgi:S1-C subfamily serine protease
VSAVVPGRPGEKAGLRAGDRIVKINGRAAVELSADERAEALKASPLALIVQRGEETVELKLTLDAKN